MFFLFLLPRNVNHCPLLALSAQGRPGRDVAKTVGFHTSTAVFAHRPRRFAPAAPPEKTVLKFEHISWLHRSAPRLLRLLQEWHLSVMSVCNRGTARKVHLRSSSSNSATWKYKSIYVRYTSASPARKSQLCMQSILPKLQLGNRNWQFKSSTRSTLSQLQLGNRNFAGQV